MTEPLKGLRVLVVEDEGLGCDVVGHASRLSDALEKARILQLDAAVLDLNLAGHMSYPVAELLLARGISVIFSTGYGAASLPAGWRDVPVLCKPFKADQLAQALSGVRAV